MNFILVSFREYRNLTEEDLAKTLSISLQEYKSLELGLDLVNAEMAVTLSMFYKAPPQVFLTHSLGSNVSFVYSHCYFNNGNGYVNNLTNDYQGSELMLFLKQQLHDLNELIRILYRKISES